MKLPKFIFNRLKTHNTSLGNNEAFPPETDYCFDYKIIKNRYEEVCNELNKIGLNHLSNIELSNKLSQLINECVQLEMPLQNQLTNLVKNIVYDLFDIPVEVIELECYLVKTIKPKHSFRLLPKVEDEPNFMFQDLTDFNNMNKAVMKRRFINSLIQGGSYIFSAIDLYKTKIQKIDPHLVSLYEQIRIINDFLLFNVQENITDKNPLQGSCVEVELGMIGEKTIITAQGLIFPFLLNDTIRGFLELFASHGLPQNNKNAIYIINQADFLTAEPWDLRLGVNLWKKICGNVTNSKIIPYFFTELCKLKTNKFNEYVKEILMGTNKGNLIFNKILKKSSHDYKLTSLITTIDKKNSKNIIVDQYMTEEEIDNFSF